jgi:hypothetical protein
LNVSFPHSFHSDSSLYCQYNSTDGERISTAKIIGSLIYCNITKSNYISTTEEIEISLVLKISFNSSFQKLSLNSHRFLLFKGPIGFEFTENYLDYTNQDSSTPRFVNFITPSVSKIFTIQFSSISPNSDQGALSSCTATPGMKLFCNIGANELKPVHQPSVYKLNMTITFSNTVNLKHTFMLNSFTYFKDLKAINDVSPKFVSFRDSFKVKSNFYLNISHPFNPTFVYYCKGIYENSTDYQISVAELVASQESTTLFKCLFNSRFKQENATVQLYFEMNNSKHLLTTSTDFNFYEFTSLMNTNGFLMNQKISIDLPLIVPGVSYDVRFLYNTILYQLQNCTIYNNSLSCILPVFNLEETSTSLEMVLYLNGYPSMKLYPLFRVYKTPQFKNISPSMNILTNSKQTLQFTVDNFDSPPRNYNYQLKYLNSKNVEIGKENCILESKSTIICSSPLISYVDQIFVWISINNIDYANFTSIYSFESTFI